MNYIDITTLLRRVNETLPKTEEGFIQAFAIQNDPVILGYEFNNNVSAELFMAKRQLNNQRFPLEIDAHRNNIVIERR